MTPAGMQLTRQHTALVDFHVELQMNVAEGALDNPTAAIATALLELEALSRDSRDRLLQGGLNWTDGDRAVCDWVAGRYDHLARIAFSAAARVGKSASSSAENSVALFGLTLLLLGHAIKWRKGAGQRADVTLREHGQRLYVLAAERSLESTAFNVVVDRESIETNVEALFIRVLLIERFSSGNLIARRLEILDTWLLASAQSIWLTRELREGGASFCVDPKSPTRPLVPYQAGSVAPLYLPLWALQRQLVTIARAFHVGTIYPGWGLGVRFRVEDHIGVMEFLERELTLTEILGVKKSKRLPIGGEVVTLFAGFNDIYVHALINQTTLTSAGMLGSAAVAAKPAFESSPPEPSRISVANALGDLDGLNIFGAVPSSVMLLDVSETGLGLEMTSDDAARIDIDSLVAVKLADGRPCIIGVVVRKANVTPRGTTLVGVKLLARVPMRATLEEVNDQVVHSTVKGIFLSGGSGGWHSDALIVNDAAYRANQTMSVTVSNGRFHVRMGRIRQQGPGWKMTAVQVIVAH